MSGNLCNLPIRELRRCPIQFQPVCKETLDYYMLRDSIRDVGILQPILVRPVLGGYEVVAGNHRFECACDLRLQEVPCLVREMTDEQVLSLQVMENASRITVDPINYVRRLQKILHSGEMTVEELAHCVHRHPDWVRNLLRLNCLSEKCKSALVEKRISTKVGIELAKLPIHYQDELLSLSEEHPANEFLEIVRAGVRNMRTQGYLDKQSIQAVSQTSLRQSRTLLDEYVNLTNAATVLMRAEASTALDGWIACLAWVLCMDEQGAAERVGRRHRKDNLKAKREELRILELKERQQHE